MDSLSIAKERPRRQNVDYNQKYSPTDRKTTLSSKRKVLITQFIGTNKNNIGSKPWKKRLHEHVSGQDATVTMGDIERWIATYGWITVGKEERTPTAPPRERGRRKAGTSAPSPLKDLTNQMSKLDTADKPAKGKPAATSTKAPPKSKGKSPVPVAPVIPSEGLDAGSSEGEYSEDEQEEESPEPVVDTVVATASGKKTGKNASAASASEMGPSPTWQTLASELNSKIVVCLDRLDMDDWIQTREVAKATSTASVKIPPKSQATPTLEVLSPSGDEYSEDDEEQEQTGKPTVNMQLPIPEAMPMEEMEDESGESEGNDENLEESANPAVEATQIMDDESGEDEAEESFYTTVGDIIPPSLTFF